jgi:hypothetical protein
MYVHHVFLYLKLPGTNEPFFNYHFQRPIANITGLGQPEGVQTITGCYQPEVEGGPGRVQIMCEATD